MNTKQIIENFMNSIKEERFKQAKRLVKKYSRNKGNELGKKLLSLGFLYGTAENYDLAIFCLELSEKISRDINIKGEERKNKDKMGSIEENCFNYSKLSRICCFNNSNLSFHQ